jgi:[ribosomal protein S5]-alanine N-acetyltransferase
MGAILETQRLSLRELEPPDLPIVTAMLADAEVMRFWPRPYTPPECEAWIERQRARYAADGCGYWLALERATGRPVGQAGILMTEVEGTMETALGYILHRPFWGRGYAVEASAGSLDFAFERLGAARAVALVRPENLPSIRVAQKLGMVPGRRVMFADLDHVVYALGREAWTGPPGERSGARGGVP